MVEGVQQVSVLVGTLFRPLYPLVSPTEAFAVIAETTIPGTKAKATMKDKRCLPPFQARGLRCW